MIKDYEDTQNPEIIEVLKNENKRLKLENDFWKDKAIVEGKSVGKQLSEIKEDTKDIKYYQRMKTRAYVLLGLGAIFGLLMSLAAFWYSSIVGLIVGLGVLFTASAGLVELIFYDKR